jgi:hypothetical protein
VRQDEPRSLGVDISTVWQAIRNGLTKHWFRAQL